MSEGTVYDPWVQPLDDEDDEKRLAEAMALALEGPVGSPADSVLVCMRESQAEVHLRGRLNVLMAEYSRGRPVRLRADIHASDDFERFVVVLYTEER